METELKILVFLTRWAYTKALLIAHYAEINPLIIYKLWIWMQNIFVVKCVHIWSIYHFPQPFTMDPQQERLLFKRNKYYFKNTVVVGAEVKNIVPCWIKLTKWTKIWQMVHSFPSPALEKDNLCQKFSKIKLDVQKLKEVNQLAFSDFHKWRYFLNLLT